MMLPLVRQLDRSRPHGVITGLLGARFEQDNILFNSAGTEVSPDQVHEDMIEEPQPKEEEAQADIKPATIAEPSPEPEAKSFEEMHWKQLKVMVETYGGEFTNKEEAIKFLSGK